MSHSVALRPQPGGPTSLRRPEGLRRLVPPLVFLALVAVVWQIWATWAQSILLPTFTATIAAFVDIVIGGAVWEPLARSKLTMIIGFLAANGNFAPGLIYIGCVAIVGVLAYVFLIGKLEPVE